MCHVTSTLTNQRRVFKACLTKTEQVSDDVTRKIGPLDFISKERDGLVFDLVSLLPWKYAYWLSSLLYLPLSQRPSNACFAVAEVLE